MFLATESKSTYTCSICGFPYSSEEAAAVCEAQGLQENVFKIGDTFKLPWCGGVTVAVIELIAACHIDHMPGIIFQAVSGNVELYKDSLQDPANRQFFDQETALRYAQNDS